MVLLLAWPLRATALSSRECSLPLASSCCCEHADPLALFSESIDEHHGYHQCREDSQCDQQDHQRAHAGGRGRRDVRGIVGATVVLHQRCAREQHGEVQGQNEHDDDRVENFQRNMPRLDGQLHVLLALLAVEDHALVRQNLHVVLRVVHKQRARVETLRRLLQLRLDRVHGLVHAPAVDSIERGQRHGGRIDARGQTRTGRGSLVLLERPSATELIVVAEAAAEPAATNQGRSGSIVLLLLLFFFLGLHIRGVRQRVIQSSRCGSKASEADGQVFATGDMYGLAEDVREVEGANRRGI